MSRSFQINLSFLAEWFLRRILNDPTPLELALYLNKLKSPKDDLKLAQ
jgi:hypothetical protein